MIPKMYIDASFQQKINYSEELDVIVEHLDLFLLVVIVVNVIQEITIKTVLLYLSLSLTSKSPCSIPVGW